MLATPSGKILGATILGPEASGVLQEFVFALEHGLTLGAVADTVHPYPTYLSVARTLGNQFNASKLDSGFVRAALRFFRGLHPREEVVETTRATGH